jgi:hypothetical protein
MKSLSFWRESDKLEGVIVKSRLGTDYERDKWHVLIWIEPNDNFCKMSDQHCVPRDFCPRESKHHAVQTRVQSPTLQLWEPRCVLWPPKFLIDQIWVSCLYLYMRCRHVAHIRIVDPVLNYCSVSRIRRVLNLSSPFMKHN